MSFLAAWLEALWGKRKHQLPFNQYDIDTAVNFPEDDEEEDDEYDDDYEYEEEQRVVESSSSQGVFATEDEFIDYALRQSNNGENLFFDMFAVETVDSLTGKRVKVWWMPKQHPYVTMLRRANEDSVENTGRIKYMDFDVHRNIVAYQDYAVQVAVDYTRSAIEKRQQQQPPPQDKVVD